MTGESVESVETKSPPQPRRGVVICVPTPGNVAVETLGAVAVAVAYLESIWIDPSINFTHRGEKVWSGNFGRWHNELPA